GTTGSDAFVVDPISALSGNISVGTYPTIQYISLGIQNSTIGLIGDQGGLQPGEIDSVSFVGTANADTYTYTPNATDSGTLRLTSVFSVNFALTHFGSVSVDASTPAPGAV